MQKRWRMKRQAGAPPTPGGARGQQARGSPSSSPTAHPGLLSDTSIDLSSGYGHRLAALLSTAPFTSVKQRPDTGSAECQLMLFPWHYFSHSLALPIALHPHPSLAKACENHQGALLDSLLPHKWPNPNLAYFSIVFS